MNLRLLGEQLAILVRTVLKESSHFMTGVLARDDRRHSEVLGVATITDCQHSEVPGVNPFSDRQHSECRE